MAGFTYSGATQPVLNDLPVTVGATTFSGGSGTLSITATPPLNVFYFLVITASVGTQRYTKGFGDSSLTINFTAAGDYAVILETPGYKPKKINVRVNP